MPDHEDLETRLRKTFRWVAGDIDPGGESSYVGGDAQPSTVDFDAEEEDSYIDDRPARQPSQSKRRSLVLVAATVLLLAAIGASVGLVASGSSGPSGGNSEASKPSDGHGGNASSAAARLRVVSALGATTAAGNWDISYSYSEVPGASASTTTTTSPTASCPTTAPVINCVTAEADQPPQNVTVTGTGTIDVSPKAMVTEADPSNFGDVVLRIDSNTVWELGSDDGAGLAPSPSSAAEAGSGSSLSGFSGLVEGTLGTREGAIAMLGIASPTGYLELDEEAINSVSASGQGTVNGEAVTQYRVSTDPTQLEKDPSASAEEISTIEQALATLQGQGLTTTTTDISVDAQGFILQSTSIYQFSDGGSVTVGATFSNFGCAGTVLMPGQTGSASPPTNCVSPDTPQSTTTTSSTAPGTPSTASTTTSSSTANPGATSTTTVPTTIQPASTAATTTTVTALPSTTTSSTAVER